VTLSSNKR